MRFFGHKGDGLGDDDLAIVARVVPGWETMTAEERDRLMGDTDRLLREKRWEAARGFELTQPTRVHIAAQASLLILGLEADTYRGVKSIVVHESNMVRTTVRPGPARGVVSEGRLTLLGEAGHGTGPVVISWDAVRADARNHERGHNVVFHEFAHKIDMLDDVIDGTPPLSDPDEVRRWIEVCTEAFDRLRHGSGSPVLRDYAALNPGEFFAVATEAFFTKPTELGAAEPDLYDVLRGFYRQDPATRGTP